MNAIDGARRIDWISIVLAFIACYAWLFLERHGVFMGGDVVSASAQTSALIVIVYAAWGVLVLCRTVTKRLLNSWAGKS